jgi:hypothetical protein
MQTAYRLAEIDCDAEQTNEGKWRFQKMSGCPSKINPIEGD